ncbi:MAG: ATP-binding cassette domain-containing protein [Hyphomicrobiales bacterium]
MFKNSRQKLAYLLNGAFKGQAAGLQYTGIVKALDGLTVSIHKGERVGIIGRNGAGKSTLLKLLAGGFPPTSGKIIINGETYSLLPGTVGFSPELSVEENASAYLLQFGFSDDEIVDKIKDIEDFVELGKFFRQPMKNLSLGMRVRSEFAAATSLNSDILIIDEVLGAGDIYWAQKCADRMQDLCAQGRTLLLVSHSLDQVMKFCDRCIWIDQGKVVMDGDTFEISKRYEGFLETLSWHTGDADDKQVPLDQVAPDLGNVTLKESGQKVVRWPGIGDLEFSGVWINSSTVTQSTVLRGDTIEIRLQTRSSVVKSARLRYLINFWSESGKRVATSENNSESANLCPSTSHTFSVTIDSSQLSVGSYILSISLFELSDNESAQNEQSTRQDLLYKSFEISVEDLNSNSSNQSPKFYTEFNSTKILD